MSKDTSDTLELVAKETGFAMGRLINVGEKFQFAKHDRNGKVRKLPKWAQPADKPLPPKKAAGAADLKPREAQTAVATKRAELAGDAKPETAANKAPDAAGDLA